MAIRVLLVDDQDLVRAGLKLVIDSQPDLEVVGEAGDGAEAVGWVSPGSGTGERVADVVLIDVRMPRMDGVEATRRIRALPHPPAVVVLTTFDLDEYVFAAVKAGASGFLLKDSQPADLLSAVRAVFSGDAVVAPSATRRLLEQFAPRLPGGEGSSPDPRLAALTAREHEVLLQVASGRSNAEIAAELVVSEATVKTHVGRVLAKLELRDRVGLVIFAYENGLVTAGEGTSD